MKPTPEQAPKPMSRRDVLRGLFALTGVCAVSGCGKDREVLGQYVHDHFRELSKEELQAKTEYLGNRPRPIGVVEKCTFCLQRARQELYPACVEVCPVGARKFGNLLDADSEVRYILAHKRVLVLKDELNTQPKFFYYFSG